MATIFVGSLMCLGKIMSVQSCVGTIIGHNHADTIKSGHKCIWAQTCLLTVMYGHNRVETIMFWNNRVWAQTCMSTKIPGHELSWAQTCVDTCLGTNMPEHKRVWAQSCGHNHIWAQTWWNRNRQGCYSLFI